MARTQSPRGGNPQNAGLVAGRGLLIVLIAIAVGVLLLARAVDPGNDTATTNSLGPTTTAAGDDTPSSSSSAVQNTTSTIEPKKAPETVVVLVANGRGVAGAAKTNADALQVLNYNLLTPTDYPSIEAKTTVYFAPGYQADAIAVATALKIEVAGVKPLPAATLPLDLRGANLVVVLGTDGQGLSPS